MHKLYLLNQDGTYQEVPSTQYGKLEYGSPSFDYMRGPLACQTIEHLSCLFDGHVVHMFIDEEGLFDADKKPNDRASAIAGNRLLRGPRLERLRYNDLTQEPPPPLATLLATGMLIVGNAFIWTGEME
jgi:hypothetical protein